MSKELIERLKRIIKQREMRIDELTEEKMQLQAQLLRATKPVGVAVGDCVRWSCNTRGETVIKRGVVQELREKIAIVVDGKTTYRPYIMWLRKV